MVIHWQRWTEGVELSLLTAALVALVMGFVYGFGPIRGFVRVPIMVLAFVVTFETLINGEGACAAVTLGPLSARSLAAGVLIAAVVYWLVAVVRFGDAAGLGSATAVAFLAFELTLFVLRPTGVDTYISPSTELLVLSGLAVVIALTLTSRLVLELAESALTGALLWAQVLLLGGSLGLSVCGTSPERILIATVAFMVGAAPPSLRPSVFGPIWQILGPPKSK